ncbi:MAG: lytic transglycosylase domain-containing protein [Syntrophales bacterium]|nr:lytic transglycosylase domain-containing protein [Syntrophales bacterium]
MRSKPVFIKITLIFFISSFIGNICEVQAQSFKRIYRNGVIYYYFSNRGEGGAGKPYLITRNNKIKVVPINRKVSDQDLEPVVQEASRHYNLPPPLVKAVIRVESNFVPTATSPKGAQGLMQLMPGTAQDLRVCNPYDIRENIWAGTRYLVMMLEKFGYSLPLALAAYNAGPQRVEKHQDIPPIKETQDFIRNVCANFLFYSGKQP